MTLQQLKYVVTVAECGNITEAAKQLFVSQPTVTSAIHDLEKEMLMAYCREKDEQGSDIIRRW